MTCPFEHSLRIGGPARLLGAALVAGLLSGCADKLDHFGKAPSFSSVDSSRDPIDPTLPDGIGPSGAGDAQRNAPPGHFPGVGMGGQHAAAYPANAPQPGGSLWGGRGAQGATPQLVGYAAPAPRGARPSLWSRAPGSLFHDRRARDVGDILTVTIDINDSASLNNSTDRSRSGEDTVATPTVYGLQNLANDLARRYLPGEVNPLEGVSASGESTSSGSGTVKRDESISLRVAARVVQVLQNGHLVVTGNQEVRVNFELRDLQVAGIIRPEDITRQNTISYDRMANARISYGGRGHITDFQQPRIGQQLVDLISPF